MLFKCGRHELSKACVVLHHKYLKHKISFLVKKFPNNDIIAYNCELVINIYFFQKTLRNPLKIHIRFTQNWYYIITAEDTKKALVIGKT